MKDILIEEKKKVERQRLQLDRAFSRVAGVRLVIFFIAVVFLFLAIKYKSFLVIALFVLAVAGFVALVRYHGRVDENLLGLKAKSTVINRFLMRFSEEWREFKNDGSEFLTKETPSIAHDLDLLGKSSLFQLINVAHTTEGKTKLANTLTLTGAGDSSIEDRFEAITELKEKTGFVLDFEATSERIVQRIERDNLRRPDLNEEDEEEQKKDEQKNTRPDSFPFWMYLMMLIVPTINILAISLVLIKDLNPSLIIITFIAGMVMTWGPQGAIEALVAPVIKYGRVAGDYHKLLKLIGEEEFSSSLLKKINERVKGHDGILSAISSLGTIGAFNNIAFNPLVHMILSGFFGWDYFIALAAYKWSSKNEGVFEESLDIISDVEELMSLSVLSMVRKTVKPVIRKGSSDLGLEMKSVYHPLLNQQTVISNDAKLTGSLTVITGSNMSGKTTFLRTIALNMVLAFTGSPVCAEYFSVPFMRVFTSMRVMDDVSGGISTFYAEILRIKEMAEYVESNPKVPALCLIDEIFKGTNSADRIVGSKEALSKLSAGNAMVIVTTHDFELCELKTQSGADVDNYHFEEYYKNNTLKFDYKIKDGRCTTRNAMAILKMAGLVQN